MKSEKTGTRSIRKVLIFPAKMGLVAALTLLTLVGCSAGEDTVKYKLILNSSGFESKKTMYAPGEEVTVRYDIIATDTDYRFYSDDVEFKQSYDGGYVLTFIMPDHDVTLNVESRNTMEYDPDAYVPDEPVPENDGIPYGNETGDDTGEGTWFCPECGTKNEGRYCSECGLKKP
ncbi:MAG: hypothetical protein K6F87_08075 [Lachnospiraceae bacterium]|nr:hypothetical protein [Lachnospiraceae bacterium]